MRETISRRLAALETRHRSKHQPRRFLLMPWDLEPDADPDDMVITIGFVRPTDQIGGERVPYIRTGIHPAEDDPASHNGRLHRAYMRDRAVRDQARTSRTYPTGTAIIPPYNGREPLEGGSYA